MTAAEPMLRKNDLGLWEPSQAARDQFLRNVGRRTVTLEDACPIRCDDDCEIGPEHCWNHHRPNHKPDWHDPAECDERTKPRCHPSTLGPGEGW